MHLQNAKYYATLYVRGAYNLIRMADGEEWKTAFRTRYGLYESLVMNFGLTNAPASFQHFINDVLHEFLDVFATAYLDDILIYSDTLAEHEQHVTRVLEALSKSGLHLKPEKCHFHCQEVKYLGLIITPGGIRMDPTKVSAIQEWEKPRNIKDVRVFLGFSNFYRRFIRAYSRVVSPLVNLTRKGSHSNGMGHAKTHLTHSRQRLPPHPSYAISTTSGTRWSKPTRLTTCPPGCYHNPMIRG